MVLGRQVGCVAALRPSSVARGASETASPFHVGVFRLRFFRNLTGIPFRRRMTLYAVRKAPGLKMSHDVKMGADLADVVDCAVRETGQAQERQQHPQLWETSVPNCRKTMGKRLERKAHCHEQLVPGTAFGLSGFLGRCVWQGWSCLKKGSPK